MSAREHLVGRGDNCVGLIRGEKAEIAIDARTGSLDQHQRLNQFARHDFARNAEML